MRLISEIATALIALWAAMPAACRGAEAYWFTGREAITASFYLIGGNYSLYVYARRPTTYASDPASQSCFFNGNFQRVSPTPDVLRIGTAVPIATIVPYKLGPTSVNFPSGLYALYVASLTNCDWKFVLNSTADNEAGIAHVGMFRQGSRGTDLIDAATLGDKVGFYAEFRSAKDEKVPASGTAQFVHEGVVFLQAPLTVARDSNSADYFYANVVFAPEYIKYVGKNTVKFDVKIGGNEFTSTSEFTLTR
jgi:hypothetical protein